ncbi:hypothetical protein E4U55_007208 [Claviceps digitariae]|nr:hypothetical protein E4U55_007208 [Claviceps digitariae]
MPVRNAINISTSRPPVPDFWNHHSRSEALINAAYGSDHHLSPLPLPPSMTDVKPSSAQPSEPYSPTYAPSPIHSDSAATEVSSPLYSCWTPNSYSSNCTSPADWEDTSPMTTTSSPAADSWSTSLTPWSDQHVRGLQHSQFIASQVSPFFQPYLSLEDEQPPKRRRLCLEMPSPQRVYNTRSDRWRL